MAREIGLNFGGIAGEKKKHIDTPDRPRIHDGIIIRIRKRSIF
jgi:hypothetical protein